MKRLADRQRRTSPAPAFKVDRAGDRVKISPDHPNLACAVALVADAFGTADGQLVGGLLNQLLDLSRTGGVASASELNFMLSLVRGITDETEALLAVQMAAIHNATMVAADRLRKIENIEQQNSASNMLNKLARTFVVQVEGGEEVPLQRRAAHSRAARHRQ